MPSFVETGFTFTHCMEDKTECLHYSLQSLLSQISITIELLGANIYTVNASDVRDWVKHARMV